MNFDDLFKHLATSLDERVARERQVFAAHDHICLDGDDEAYFKEVFAGLVL